MATSAARFSLYRAMQKPSKIEKYAESYVERMPSRPSKSTMGYERELDGERDRGESNSSNGIRPCPPSCVSAEFSYVSVAAQFASIRPCSLALGAELGASARRTPSLTCESRPGHAAEHGFEPPTGNCL